MPPDEPAGVDRRRFLGLVSAAGLLASADLLPASAPASALGRTPLARALADDEPITKEMVTRAAALIGLAFSDSEIELMMEGLEEQREAFAGLRAVPIPNSLPPALVVDPLAPARDAPAAARPYRPGEPAAADPPADPAGLALLPVHRLAGLLRERRITSTGLTELYLDRLKRHGPRLECVVTLTEERALEQAARADAEIAAGRWRGPLHGIPWGAKDLLAVAGYPTTWGARPFVDQTIDEDAEVVRRLDAAGAVLVAKLTLGALAWGDVWFGGMTRNPWNLEQGSSGSSAGSAAATVAGLVGFAIGSETLGSIVSPCTRTGATGLRPTFGAVPRTGAMALSWSMDKLGPICRSVEDCALVYAAIRGPDGVDPSVPREVPFGWDPAVPLADLRVGFLESAFEPDEEEDEDSTRPFDVKALEVLRGLGAELLPVRLPGIDPGPMRIVLSAEAAAAFDELTRSGRDDEMVRQVADAWPNVFRHSRLVPAVEYLLANRLRTRLVAEMEAAMAEVDVFVSPSFAGGLLLTTNLTGHPAVVLPNGFRQDGTPVSITFTGRLHGDAEALMAARHYQAATGFHHRRPPGFE
ncbi:MAG TPA: amidase [Gemmatimonadota bacterium]|nr:amidase [Gemmatimonadota bacterium]